MATAINPPDTNADVFSELIKEDQALAFNRARLQLVCRELECANGSGDGVRRRILSTLKRVVGVKNESGR